MVLSGKNRTEVNFLKSNPETDVVHSNYDYYKINGEFIKHWASKKNDIPVGNIFLSLYSLNYPHNAHLRYELTSKKIIEEIGYYDEQIPIWVDWDFRLRLAAKYKFGYCHYTGSAYTENPEGLTNVLKQETVLKYLQYVIEKNKPGLKKYSEPDARKAYEAICLPVEKLKLAIDLRKNHPSFFKTIRFLFRYPAQITDIRFIINSMFGQEILKSLSKLKKKLNGA